MITIPPIFIDTKKISEDFAIDQSGINDLMDFTVKSITARFAHEWENEANRSLHSSRSQYINSIVVVDQGRAKGAVVLTGQFPNMIESGASSWDMKENLLNGPNAKTGADGKKYNTVPFSVGTPGSLPENFNGGIMPQEIYDIISERPENEPLEKYDLKNLPMALKEPQKKKIKMPESKSFKDYQHKHSINEGISKKVDSKTGQTSYKSFRRVSENSDEAAFIHPGLSAQNLAEKALANFDIPSEAGRIFDKWVEATF